MNRINVQQTGGFPLETDTLNEMQKAYEIFNSLGNIIAPLAIIKGCELTGNYVANGVVYIQGEVIEFRGGSIGDTVIIKEDDPEDNKRLFQNGDNKLVYRKRYATFGSSVVNDNFLWADFYRSVSLKEIGKRLVHVGFIQDYYGDVNNIPKGWFLCNGTNGTPDLRGMFVVGYDNRIEEYNSIGKTGGAKEVTLNVNQLPKHKHDGFTSIDGNHIHSGFKLAGSNADNGDPGHYVNTSRVQGNGLQDNAGQTSSSGSHSHTLTITESGGSQAHENRPPFYVLAKIMYKG